MQTGWFIALKFEDDEVWEDVEPGSALEYAMRQDPLTATLLSTGSARVPASWFIHFTNDVDAAASICCELNTRANTLMDGHRASDNDAPLVYHYASGSVAQFEVVAAGDLAGTDGALARHNVEAIRKDTAHWLFRCSKEAERLEAVISNWAIGTSTPDPPLAESLLERLRCELLSEPHAESVLRVLGDYKGKALMQYEIQEELRKLPSNQAVNTGKPSVSKSVDWLEEKGLAERVGDRKGIFKSSLGREVLRGMPDKP